MNRMLLLVTAMACLFAGCTEATLAQAQAQATLDRWVDGDRGPSRDGKVTVAGIQPGPEPKQVIAELRLTSFPDQDGHISPSVDPGQATFSLRSDGKWVLTSVVWDEGRRTAMPDLEVP